MLRGGDIVVNALEDLGVQVVFGVPGEHTDFLYDAIDQAKTVRHVLMRDEAHCVYAADAYARASGKMGVCDSTVGPGSSKLLSGLAEALNSSVALLALVGGYDSRDAHYIDKGRMSQGVHQEDYLKPVCKKVFSVHSIMHLYEVLHHAAICACTGTCGPVAVIIPVDILSAIAPDDFHPKMKARPAVFPLFPTVTALSEIKKAATIIANAQRPIIIAGGGVLSSGAEKYVSMLADKYQIPVATTFSGKGSISEKHPLSVGFIGNMGIPTAEPLLRSADLVIIAGAKASQNMTYNWTFPSEKQAVIQLDIDPEEMLLFSCVKCCLVGDCSLTMEILEKELSTIKNVDRAEWINEVKQAKENWLSLKVAEESASRALVSPQEVMEILQTHFTSDTCIVADASFSSSWVAEYIVQSEAGKRCFFPRGLAVLGWALPAAIGLCETGMFHKVIVVAGDGAFSYSLCELATITDHSYPIFSVVLNNSSLGWWRILHTINFDTDTQLEPTTHLAFDSIGQAFDIPSCSANENQGLCSNVSKLISLQGPAILNVDTEWHSSPIWSLREELGKSLKKKESMDIASF